MVPIEKPYAAHDMFLRFANISVLSAAGPSARLPSRLGNESVTLIGQTKPNGGNLTQSAEAPTKTSEAVYTDDEGNIIDATDLDDVLPDVRNDREMLYVT